MPPSKILQLGIKRLLLHIISVIFAQALQICRNNRIHVLIVLRPGHMNLKMSISGNDF